MKIAGIEIGTNSARYLVVELSDNKNVKILKQGLKTVGLGRNLNSNSIISDKKIQKAIDVLISFLDEINKYNIDDFIIFGTEVFRKFKGMDKLINKFYNITEKKLEILTGESESILSFKGAVFSVKKKIDTSKIMMFDIGGGSTEVALGEKDSTDFKAINNYSFDIGCVNITEKLSSELPYKKNEIDNIYNEITDKINIKESGFKDYTFIGVGGTITALASIIMNLEFYDNNKINGSTFTADCLFENINKLLNMKLTELHNFPGLNDNRSEIFPAGLIILKALLNEFEVNNLIVSDNGVLLGKIIEYYESEIL